MGKAKNSHFALNGDHLLQMHKLHLGLYARVAADLGVSPSYVSLVANGIRSSEKVRHAVLQEIARIHRISR